MKLSVAPSRAWLWWIGGPLLFWGLWSFLASRNPVYSSERLLWPAQVAALRVCVDPDSAPPASVQRTLSKLQQVIQRYPGSNAAAQAQLLIGRVYAARKEYPSARQAFERTLADYPSMTSRKIEAYRAIAATYLTQKSWEKAIETYRTILSNYPKDPRVLDVPQIMVAVARPNTPDAGESILREAIQHYRLIIDQSKQGSTLYLLAQQRLAGCYLLAGRWKDAAQIYETLVMTYFNRREVPLWIRSVEELGKKQLGDPSRGRNLALRFVEQHPERRPAVERWLKQ